MRMRTIFGLLLVIAGARAAVAEDCTFHTPTDVAIAKELMITDLSVVNDARAGGATGAWSFGGLMAAMAPKTEDAGRFVKAWLKTWRTTTQINGFALEARPDIDKVIIAPWMQRDGAKSFDDWQVNFANAPFRLLAIVYRPDLGIITADNKIADAGEGRFVFSALDLRSGKSIDAADPLPFTVIFEYGLKANDRGGVKATTHHHAREAFNGFISRGVEWGSVGPPPAGADGSATAIEGVHILSAAWPATSRRRASANARGWIVSGLGSPFAGHDGVFVRVGAYAYMGRRLRSWRNFPASEVPI